MPSVVSAAMRPAAVLAISGVANCMRMCDAMASAMLRFHANDAVQVATLQALRVQAELVPAPRRTLELLGFAMSAQLMRAQMAPARPVREAAAALCVVLGVMAVAPLPRPVALDAATESEGEGSDDEGYSSSIADWDEAAD